MEESFEIKKANFLDFANFEDFPKEIKPLTKTEKREILLREIYDFYKAEYDKRRKENWKRYIAWLKANRIPDSKENQRKFKRTKSYIREISYESLKWLLRHKSVDDLPYFVSTGKEFSHTGRGFSPWLMQWVERVDK